MPDPGGNEALVRNLVRRSLPGLRCTKYFGPTRRTCVTRGELNGVANGVFLRVSRSPGRTWWMWEDGYSLGPSWNSFLRTPEAIGGQLIQTGQRSDGAREAPGFDLHLRHGTARLPELADRPTSPIIPRVRQSASQGPTGTGLCRLVFQRFRISCEGASADTVTIGICAGAGSLWQRRHNPILSVRGIVHLVTPSRSQSDESLDCSGRERHFPVLRNERDCPLCSRSTRYAPGIPGSSSTTT